MCLSLPYHGFIRSGISTLILMTAIKTFIENHNNHVDSVVLEQSIAKALLDPATKDDEIKSLFSSFGFARYITVANLRE